MGGSTSVGLDLDPKSSGKAARVVDTDAQAIATSANRRGGARAGGQAHSDKSERAVHAPDAAPPLSPSPQGVADLPPAVCRSVVRGVDQRNGLQNAPTSRGAADKRPQFPLKTRQEVIDYLATLDGDVEVFVFEFSGAAASERAKSKQVFVVDLRAPEHGQPCYQGDVRDVIDLRMWSIAWFLGPNCFNQMRRDKHAAHKIADGRAFWAIAFVEWCLDCPYARAIVLEQPDTIAHDFINMSGRHNTFVLEFRSSWLGDTRDKFIRLTTVNMGSPKLTGLMKQKTGLRVGRGAGGDTDMRMREDAIVARPKHTDYPNAEARDKDRSSWLPLVNTTKWVTQMEAMPGRAAPHGEYVKRIRALGISWRDAARPLPVDHDNADAQPTSQATRDYQNMRGAGLGSAAPSHSPQAPATTPARVAEPRALLPRPARIAEHGDQRVVSDCDSTFLSMVNRKVRDGNALTRDQQAKLDCLAMGGAVEGPLFFWSEKLSAGQRGCLSNYFTSDFRDDDLLSHSQEFHSVEQYMHWVKAMISTDFEMADQIRAAREPAECRRLGREIRGYDEQKWNPVAILVVERGVYLKFQQNATLREYLLSTTGRELVEASPSDRRWGIGYTERDALKTSRVEWGENRLGTALMRARLRLRLGNEPAVPSAVAQAVRHRQTHGGGARPLNPHVSPRLPPAGGHVSMAPLSRAMQTLAEILGPDDNVVDRGAAGDCGPNSLSYAAWLGGIIEQDDGLKLRKRVCAHADALLRANGRLQLADGSMSVRTLLHNAMASWAPAGMRCSAERWVSLMNRRGVWADHAFLMMAAELLQVEIKYYSVKSNAGLCHVDTLPPSGGVVPKACLRLALELDTHFCAVVEAGVLSPMAGVRGGAATPPAWEAEYRGAAGDTSCSMVPTESQWLMLLEESTELAKEGQMAALTADEFESLIAAVSASQSEIPTLAVTEAVKESVKTLRLHEDAQLAEGIRRSLATSNTTLVEGGDTLILDGDDLMPVVPNEQVDAEAMHATSTNLKLAADSVARADYDMASLERRGGASTPPAWETEHRGASADATLSTARAEREWLMLLEESTELAQVVAQADYDMASLERRSATALVADASNPPLQRIDQERSGAGTLLVVPYTMHEGQPMVLLPGDERELLAIPGGAESGDVVAKAERSVERQLAPEGVVVGFTAGRHESGARLVVVATAGLKQPIAPTAKARRNLVSAGAALIWCTLAALTAPTWAMQVAGVAVATASHFVTHDGTTSWMMKNELRWRHATGLEPGRAPLQTPLRPSFPEGEVTPRMLLAGLGTGLEELKSMCRGRVEHKVYFDEWADAAKPMNVAELAPELLDQPVPGLHDLTLLAEELFSEPLPVYETPWLDRAPNQVWEEREGCAGFVARTALDLIDDDGRRELRTWFRAAQKDALCLEEKGPDCDRRDKPPTIAIGQDQVHRCAQGYVWDCRRRPCKLMDYTAKHHTGWNMDYLERKLEHYPDQRLRSNVIDGIRLEADMELTGVFNPQLVSIGTGYDSVQKTVRELEEKNFYDFFEEMPFMPMIVVGQGSRIKKLGSKVFRRTSNFSGPHQLVMTKWGIPVVPINEASRCYLIPKWMAEHPQGVTRQWAKNKYAHVPPATPERPKQSTRHKFPKEKKPMLGDVMRDLAILLHASLVMGEPIFLWVEDAAFYFNQVSKHAAPKQEPNEGD